MLYIVSKLFTYLFLPPGIFIIILTIAGFFAKKFKWLFFVSAFFLYLISIKPVANILISPLENITYKDNIKPVAVVVLGGGTNSKDTLKAYPDAFKREVYGLLIAKKENLPFIFTGGGLGKTKEAENIKKDITLLSKTCNCNIKAYYENLSLNTYQNAKYTVLLFKKLNMPLKIYLVTSAYHMKRSIALFKHFGFKIIPKPVGFFYDPDYTIWDIFPNEGNFHKSYKAIHEYFGLLSLKLRGI
ncbi:YdcF family protein [Caminibacter profundus]